MVAFNNLALLILGFVSSGIAAERWSDNSNDIHEELIRREVELYLNRKYLERRHLDQEYLERRYLAHLLPRATSDSKPPKKNHPETPSRPTGPGRSISLFHDSRKSSPASSRSSSKDSFKSAYSHLSRPASPAAQSKSKGKKPAHTTNTNIGSHAGPSRTGNTSSGSSRASSRSSSLRRPARPQTPAGSEPYPAQGGRFSRPHDLESQGGFPRPIRSFSSQALQSVRSGAGGARALAGAVNREVHTAGGVLPAAKKTAVKCVGKFADGVCIAPNHWAKDGYTMGGAAALIAFPTVLPDRKFYGVLGGAGMYHAAAAITDDENTRRKQAGKEPKPPGGFAKAKWNSFVHGTPSSPVLGPGWTPPTDPPAGSLPRRHIVDRRDLLEEELARGILAAAQW